MCHCKYCNAIAIFLPRRPGASPIISIFPLDLSHVLTALGRALDDGEREDRAIMEKEGHTFTDLDPEERMRWREMIEPALKAAWMPEIANAQIDDPEALYARAAAAMDNAEKQLNGNR